MRALKVTLALLPAYLAQGHGVAQCSVVDNLGKALRGLAQAAVQ